MSAERKDREWLQGKLVALLEDASGGEEPDHAACTAYATLLYKMLPPAETGKHPSWLDQERERLRASKGGDGGSTEA